MGRTLLTLAAALTFIAAASAEEKSKTYSFGKITGIDASFTYEIHVTSGSSDNVEIVFDSEYEPYMKVSYSSYDSSLYLGMDELPRKIRNSNHSPIKVFLKMKEIDEIELSGASSISFDGMFKASDLEVDLSGASHLNGPLKINGRRLSIDASGAANASLTGDFQKVEMDISGAANVYFVGNGTEMEGELSGAAKLRFKGEYADSSIECSGAAHLDMEGKGNNLELEGSGACNIDAKDYMVRKASVELSGASKAKVRATDDLLLDVDRTCRLTYYGDPAISHMSSDSNIVRGGL